MTLQLMPADLGRLDIKLKFGKDGGIKAHLSVDKPETLAMLQKDSSHLQRALQDAGFDTDDSTLSFDLRHQGQHQPGAQAQEDSQRGHGFRNYTDGKQNDATLQAQIAVQAYGYISQSGVNIMV
jgi:flagellar hook-length control protein FliK